MSTGKVVFGALIGMAVGAVLGVLFAPAKGVNTRKQLSQKASQYVGTLKDKGGEFADALGEELEGAKETAVGLSAKVEEAVGSLTADEPSKHTRQT